MIIIKPIICAHSTPRLGHSLGAGAAWRLFTQPHARLEFGRPGGATLAARDPRHPAPIVALVGAPPTYMSSGANQS